MILGEAVSVSETLCVPNISQNVDNILYHILILKAFDMERILCTCYVGDKDTKRSKFELMIAGLCARGWRYNKQIFNKGTATNATF